jgi:UDP-N-acetyl-D-glucosamine dehydrogenase
MKIVVMGQGYVGLPLAMAAAKVGHNVVGYEPDRERCKSLLDCASYVEDVTDLDLMEASASGRYKPTDNESDLQHFDVAVITVPTPLYKGVPDLSYVKAAASTLGLYLTERAVVVLESTTYPGTTRDVVVPMLEIPSELTAGRDFHVGFSPERIDPGNKEWTFINTPKIVSGLTDRCRVLVERFYRSITDNVVPARSLEEAELSKVFENTYRQVNIALVNELQRHANALGVDVHHVLDLADTKPFGFTRFSPGPGVGGHCIPCDPVYLTHHLRTEIGSPFRLVELAQEINESQPAYVVQRLRDILNRNGIALRGAHILALGQSYKPDTADMRQSPAVEVVKLLREQGTLVHTVDPHFPPPCGDDEFTDVPVVFGNDDYRHLRDDYHVVVLLTPHSGFDLQAIADSGVCVLDTRGVMPDAPNVERL